MKGKCIKNVKKIIYKEKEFSTLMIVKQKICFYHTLQLHFNVIGLMENDAKKDDCYKIKEISKIL